jgi:8-oxo-dGTP diphosphatase
VSSTHPQQRPITEVAVGIILHQGQFLLAKRPAGKPYAGYWEFPGGKVEKGETVHQALARELKEELDIQIHESLAWDVIEHDYPHAYVRLHLSVVRSWDGIAKGLEGQELLWQKLALSPESTPDPLLPATIIIIEMMLQKNLLN